MGTAPCPAAVNEGTHTTGLGAYFAKASYPSAKRGATNRADDSAYMTGKDLHEDSQTKNLEHVPSPPTPL